MTKGPKMSGLQVTTSNKNASNHILKCNTTGLFLSDATPDFNTISITLKAGRALPLADFEAAEHARKFVAALYPSFDWQSVPA
jgi:hypothetical protein